MLIDGQLVAYLAEELRNTCKRFYHRSNRITNTIGGPWSNRWSNCAQQDPLLLSKINGMSAHDSPLAPTLKQAGFITLSKGLLHRGNGTPSAT